MSERSIQGDERVLVCQAGSGYYGIPLKWVIAAHVNEKGSGEAKDKERFEFRGEEIPVFDMNRWLCGQKTAGVISTYLILGREKAEKAAVVENPGEVVSGMEVHEWPELCQNMIEDAFSGVMIDQNRLVLMIDPERLLSSISQGGESGKGGGVL